MRIIENPSFSKEYANKVKKTVFIDHFKDVYTTLSADNLGEQWEALQEKKEAKPKTEK